MTRVVLDTNIVLDLWLFSDPKCIPLQQDLDAGALQWQATQPMRDELARVLTYPHLNARLQKNGQQAQALLARYDQAVTWQAVAPKAIYVCKDADDQKFVDLAVTQQALLISKDAEVLALKNRLARLGVPVLPTYPSSSSRAQRGDPSPAREIAAALQASQ